MNTLFLISKNWKKRNVVYKEKFSLKMMKCVTTSIIFSMLEVGKCVKEEMQDKALSDCDTGLV